MSEHNGTSYAQHFAPERLTTDSRTILEGVNDEDFCILLASVVGQPGADGLVDLRLLYEPWILRRLKVIQQRATTAYYGLFVTRGRMAFGRGFVLHDLESAMAAVSFPPEDALLVDGAATGDLDADAWQAELLDIYDHGLPGGLVTGWPTVDRRYRVRPGELTIVTGVSNHLKALALDTPLPTPDGWISMGDVTVGQILFDEHGLPCQVLATTPVYHGQPCYAIEFDDGTVIVADAGHQWLTTTTLARRSAKRAHLNARDIPRVLKPRGTDQTYKRTFPAVVTTEDIASSVRIGRDYNHAVAVAEALECSKHDLPISPYVLGAWLGDGTSDVGGITTADQDILDEIIACGYTVTKWKGRYRYGIVGLTTQLRHLGVLKEKHIPQHYLRGSTPQRLALLQGLMDTDGSVTPYGRCTFSNTNHQLALEAAELMRTLGLKPRVIEWDAKLNGRLIGRVYGVTFTPHIPVFRLPRKAQFVRFLRTSRTATRRIVRCEPVTSVPVRCITVDSPSHLYLASRGCIPTHNSQWLHGLTVNLALMHDWQIGVWAGEHRPALLGASLASLYANQAFDGPQQMARDDAVAAGQWCAQHFHVIEPADEAAPTVPWLLTVARYQVQRYGIQALVLDPWNHMSHPVDRTRSETLYISEMLSQLLRFAKHWQVHVWVVVHPTKLQKAQKGKYAGQYPVPSPYDISGSAAWYAKADNVLALWRDVEAHPLDVELHVQKVRFRGADKLGMVPLRLDLQSGRFQEPTAVSHWSEQADDPEEDTTWHF